MSAVPVRPHEVKHLLHKEVFHPNGERLIGFTKVISVMHCCSRRSNSLLCSISMNE